MSRKCPDGILPAVCKYTEGMEAPPEFVVWSTIVTLSAVLGRDCFIDQGYFTIYPNVYVVLVASSARCRKSTSISIAKDFLDSLPNRVNVLGQKMTPEALIGALSGMEVKEGESMIIPSAIGVAIVSELSTLVDRNSFKSGMIALLTDLYDCKDFEYITRKRGRELVKNPFLSVLGGSTIQWIKEAIPEISIGGGFTSRVIFIYKDSRTKLVPWPVVTEEQRFLREAIIHDLAEIHKMRGPFALDDAALELYKEEYTLFNTHNPLMDDDGLSGYANRRHHTLLKVAMCVSASHSDDRLITYNDLKMSLNLMKVAESSMPLVLRALVSKEVGDIFESIVMFLMKNKVVSKSMLVKQYRHKMTSAELDILMRTLEDEGVVNIEFDGKSVRYVYVK